MCSESPGHPLRHTPCWAPEFDLGPNTPTVYTIALLLVLKSMASSWGQEMQVLWPPGPQCLASSGLSVAQVK